MKILNKDLDDYVLGNASLEKKNKLEKALKGNDVILKNKISEIKIIHYISNFIISNDIISSTNQWKKSFSNDRPVDISESELPEKSKSIFSVRNFILFVIITTLLLIILAGRQLWSGKKNAVITNEPFVETININQKWAPVKTSEPIYTEDDKNDTISERSLFKTKTQSDKINYKQIAMAMLPTTKFEILRDDSKNTFGEKVYKFYAKNDLKSLLSIKNNFSNKGITNEYLDDFIGRLWIKRGDFYKAMIIYTELTQIDSPNVDEYEFLLLLTYYADLPDSKFNFSQLQEYIAGDTLHTYFKIVKQLEIN